VIGWLLLGAVLLLLGVVIIGFQFVLRGFTDVHKELRALRTQFDTVIRLQSTRHGDRNAFQMSTSYTASDDRTLQ
jgi:hypothetical protein